MGVWVNAVIKKKGSAKPGWFSITNDRALDGSGENDQRTAIWLSNLVLKAVKSGEGNLEQGKLIFTRKNAPKAFVRVQQGVGLIEVGIADDAIGQFRRGARRPQEFQAAANAAATRYFKALDPIGDDEAAITQLTQEISGKQPEYIIQIMKAYEIRYNHRLLDKMRSDLTDVEFKPAAAPFQKAIARTVAVPAGQQEESQTLQERRLEAIAEITRKKLLNG